MSAGGTRSRTQPGQTGTAADALYGDAGVEAMRQLKRSLDPDETGIRRAVRQRLSLDGRAPIKRDASGGHRYHSRASAATRGSCSCRTSTARSPSFMTTRSCRGRPARHGISWRLLQNDRTSRSAWSAGGGSRTCAPVGVLEARLLRRAARSGDRHRRGGWQHPQLETARHHVHELADALRAMGDGIAGLLSRTRTCRSPRTSGGFPTR